MKVGSHRQNQHCLGDCRYHQQFEEEQYRARSAGHNKLCRTFASKLLQPAGDQAQIEAELRELWLKAKIVASIIKVL
jgi:hypothetical protein